MSTNPAEGEVSEKKEEQPCCGGGSEQEALDREATQMTCDVLCSLSSSTPPRVGSQSTSPVPADTQVDQPKRRTSKTCPSSKTCPKQLQLPMFLSKTYHMIDRCDSDIATWSESGDNFIVKNVEKFATNVLPLYFKHSNFSSFARQLNFYGFRKLRTDPILTKDVDPRTSCYVRFYHEKFQKDKPELLHQIKRATKTDQQSKDDLESLKQEVAKLREANAQMKEDFDRRLAELSYECNRRVTALNADYDKLFALVQPLLTLNKGDAAATAVATAALRDAPTRTQMPDLLHSLSHAAVSLQNHLRAPPPSSIGSAGSGVKRPSEETNGAPPQARPRFI